MSYARSTDVYDLIYAGKDYVGEAREVARLIRRACPSARTVLDVACGTGAHDEFLAEEFAVDGLDLEPDFLSRAAARNPAGRYVQGDMIDFHLDRRYDAVICLFSAIGYVRTIDGLAAALRCFAQHTHPGGVVIVEPWVIPDEWQGDRVSIDLGEGDGIKVCRMIKTHRDGPRSFLDAHYLVGTERGIEHRHEHHELGLFTVDQYRHAFEQAGLAVEHEPHGLTGRGLFIGIFRR